MAKWKHQATLRQGHGWRAKDGNVGFIADCHAVHIEIPRDWVIELNVGTPAIDDKQPPDDESRWHLTVIRLPPWVAWSKRPLAPMLEEALDNLNDPDHEPTAQRGEITTQDKRGIEPAWIETAFIGKAERRPIRSRTVIPRGDDVPIRLTFDVWPDAATRVLPVWKGVLRGLRRREYVDDPLRGPQRVDKGIGLPRRPRT